MSKFKVVCINDKQRPAEIPPHLWIESHEIYTVKAAHKMHYQPGCIGLVLEEIVLPPDCPYQSFNSLRFRPATDDDFEALQAVAALLEEVAENELLTL